MKKTAFLCLSFALLFNFLPAQNSSLGLSVGMGIANFDGISNSRIAGSLGIIAQHSLSDRFSLNANLGYSLKGGKEQVSQKGGAYDQYDADILTSFHTLNLDLAFDYNLLSKLKLGLGPYFALLLNARERNDATFTTAGVTLNRNYVRDITFLYHPLDFGLLAQIHYQFSDAFSLGFRFRQGIPNAFAIESIPLVQRNQSLDLVANIFLSKK